MAQRVYYCHRCNFAWLDSVSESTTPLCPKCKLHANSMTAPIALYHRCFVYDPETEHYSGYVPECPGCLAEAESFILCWSKLEQALGTWLEACIQSGQSVPFPYGTSFNPWSVKKVDRR